MAQGNGDDGGPGYGAGPEVERGSLGGRGSQAAPPGRVGGIQILRGIAATLVVGFHLYWSGANSAGYSGPFALFANGEAGVDLFFVISGFIIYYTSVGRRRSPWRFLALRFWRIFPPYWLLLGMTIALLVVETRLTGAPSDRLGLDRLVASFLLLPAPGQIIPIAWTLSIEILFYLLFAASFFRFGRRGFFIAMVAWVLASQLYAHQDVLRAPWLNLVLFGGVLEFLLGAAIAGLALAGRTPLQIPALILGTLWFAALVTASIDLSSAWFGREITAGIPAALVVYGVIGIRRTIPDALHLWGESSYLLYLSHLLVFGLAGEAARRGFGLDIYGQSWTMAAMLVLAVILALLATRYLERPYQAWYHRRLKRDLDR